MVRRLHMTGADYVVIAVSPALIIALITSLVFFLIDVLYVGQYQARLNYVFALFVFAAVLIARIAIEMGSERAAVFALPLGVATFMVLTRFVEHPGPFSPLINLALIGIVWWCAHKLTWDCTLIDDEEDASGLGLMQRIGVEDDAADLASNVVTENELLSDADEPRLPWWRRWKPPSQGPHAPGLWVLYFSLAALPLFGIGHRWIPVIESGRRQYAFSLLVVYVAAGLSLLVTTSFLGLRRYLRQRRVEMPAPMAATWISVGAVLVVLVMIVAALLPRPHAEYAISQVPWQVRSPEGLSSSRRAMGNDGANQHNETGPVVEHERKIPANSATDEWRHGESATEDNSQKPSGNQQLEEDEGSSHSKSASSSAERDGTGRDPDNEKGKPDHDAERSSRVSRDDTGRSRSGDRQSGFNLQNRQGARREQSEGRIDAGENRESRDAEQEADSQHDDQRRTTRFLQHGNRYNPAAALEQLPSLLGGLVGALKIAFYGLVALLLIYLMWNHRQPLLEALLDIVHQIRLLVSRLFDGSTKTANRSVDGEATSSDPERRSFADYPDPFTTGRHNHDSPAELVRYTFEAFEAWCNEAGYPRTPDQTPLELIRGALEPRTPLYNEARRMVRLYSELAYARRDISREAASELRSLWHLMLARSPSGGDVRNE